MALDAYALCPCGSGKKLKFCCANLAEDMERISRQIEGNQPRQALQQLEALDRRLPQHPWVVTTRALVELEIGDAAAARDRLREFLQHQPDHDFAIVLEATSAFQVDGLDAAKKSIHRAFQRGLKRFPTMVAGLAGAMAAVYQSRGQVLAAREHLALAMRFSPDRERQEIFVRLLEFDNNAAVPYILRSVHPLPTIPGDDAVQTEVKKALKYATVGCWSVSADVFDKLANAHPQVAAIHHAAGLCHAWDGDEPGAAKALHKAASLYEDAAAAVECETIAQLFDWNTTDKRRERRALVGTISSVSRLLTKLDAEPRLFRMELPPQGPNGEELPTAIYQVLDRDKSAIPAPQQLTRATVPTVLAQITIFDADEVSKEPAEIEVSALAGSDADTAIPLTKAAASDLVTWRETTEEVEGWVPEETLALSWQWAFPPKTPIALRRRLENERWSEVIGSVWPNQPLQGLGGRTPLEAAKDPSKRIPLMAAVYVLDAQCLRAGHALDTDALLARLGIEGLPPFVVTPETSLASLTPLQWQRLPLATLTDAQMLSAVNRALLVHHDRFLQASLEAAVTRAECLKELDLNRVYQTLSDLCRQHGQRHDAFKWLAAGRAQAAQHANSFEQVWSWDLRELLARLEDPTDPELPALTHKFVTYYAPKLPQMRPYVEQMFEMAGVPSPWSTGGIVTGTDLPTTPGGLWTPDSAQPTAPAGKLWIPGS